MIRKSFYNNSRKLSYVDYGGDGEIIIALHGHFGCANMFAQLANGLSGSYRIIALDQQGHGYSDWGTNYTRIEYISDIEELYNQLHIVEAILLGHSLGGVNAYQFASKHPEKVSRLIVEDIGAIIDDDLSFILEWPEKFFSIKSCMEYVMELGIDNFIYFFESLKQDEDGWRFQFDSQGLVKSQINLNGNWLRDWNSLSCKVLLMHGENSHVLSSNHALEISKSNQNVKLKEFENCGHTIRDINFEGYKHAIVDFLEEYSG